MRLDKYLCKSTDLTKPEAIERIRNSEVNVNSETVTDESTQVHESNTILLNSTPLHLREFPTKVFRLTAERTLINTAIFKTRKW